MITDTKTVVSTLIVVLFLTMILINPNMIDFSYFCVLLSFAFKLKP